MKQVSYLAQDPNKKPVKRENTAGETIFNEITYRGVDFGLNAAFGISFAYFTSQTKLGRSLWNTPVTNGFKHILKPFLKAEKLEGGAGAGATFLSIMAGGTAIIPPIMALENNKDAIIESIDRRIYGDKEVDENPRFSLAYKVIAQEPEKSFSIGMASRVIALTPLFYAHINYKPECTKWLYSWIGEGSRLIAKQTGVKATKMKSTQAFGEEKGVNQWEFLHNLIGMDLGLTFIYSYLHEYSYKTLSIFGHKNETPTEKPDQSIDADSVKYASHVTTQEPQPPSYQIGAS